MEATLVRYEKPDDLPERGRVRVGLAQGDIVEVGVQILRVGGENRLHSHHHREGFWFVLRGRARFYTTDDEILGEFGPHEGVVIPRDFPYWFESCSADDLEMLQVESNDGGNLDEDKRVHDVRNRPQAIQL